GVGDGQGDHRSASVELDLTRSDKEFAWDHLVAAGWDDNSMSRFSLTAGRKRSLTSAKHSKCCKKNLIINSLTKMCALWLAAEFCEVGGGMAAELGGVNVGCWIHIIIKLFIVA